MSNNDLRSLTNTIQRLQARLGEVNRRRMQANSEDGKLPNPLNFPAQTRLIGFHISIMAILEIVCFCLINPQLRIEDTSTPVGRIWGSLLHHILEQHQRGGILSASWGRLSQKPEYSCALY